MSDKVRCISGLSEQESLPRLFAIKALCHNNISRDCLLNLNNTCTCSIQRSLLTNMKGQ